MTDVELALYWLVSDSDEFDDAIWDEFDKRNIPIKVVSSFLRTYPVRELSVNVLEK